MSRSGKVPFRNPFRAAIKRLRADGWNKQAKALKRAQREAEDEVLRLTRAQKPDTVEPDER